MRRLLPGLCLLLASAGAFAQTVRDGNYVVHYAAMSTQDLPAVMARQYGIRQGGGHAMLLLNLQRDSGGQHIAVHGEASGTARNLMGDVQPLTLRPAGGDSPEDLIAEFDVDPLQVLTFDIDVRPEGATHAIKVKFQQQFFGEDD